MAVSIAEILRGVRPGDGNRKRTDTAFSGIGKINSNFDNLKSAVDPLILAPPAHTHAHSDTTGRTANDHHNKSHAHNGADGSGTVAFASLASKPTTMAGYGISDTKANFNIALSDGSFAFSGGAFHDGFSDYVAAEHVDWAGASAGTIHASNYVDNDTIYSHPNHTGEVTSIGDGALTIADDAVTYAKMQNVAADQVILGNIGGAAGIVSELTAAQVRTLINVEDGSTADQTSIVGITGTKANFNIALSDGDFIFVGDAPSAHTILSHDTTATGSELTSLADNSMVDTLHRHSELSASDGSPDSVVQVNAAGLATFKGDIAMDRAIDWGTYTPGLFGSNQFFAVQSMSGAFGRPIIAGGSIASNQDVFVFQAFGKFALVGYSYFRFDAILQDSGGSGGSITGSSLIVDFTNNDSSRFAVRGDGIVLVPNMPTSDPAISGALWSDGGTIKISA